MIWVFIGIGFLGALFLTTSAIVNMVRCIKNKSYDHIHIWTQVSLMVANILFFIYALGISLYNRDSHIFWNSVPTWVGSLTPFILNLIMIIGKCKTKHKKHV
jgi:uncharacterized protein with PQ loop repeat